MNELELTSRIKLARALYYAAYRLATVPDDGWLRPRRYEDRPLYETLVRLGYLGPGKAFYDGVRYRMRKGWSPEL